MSYPFGLSNFIRDNLGTSGYSIKPIRKLMRTKLVTAPEDGLCFGCVYYEEETTFEFPNSCLHPNAYTKDLGCGNTQIYVKETNE